MVLIGKVSRAFRIVFGRIFCSDANLTLFKASDPGHLSGNATSLQLGAGEVGSALRLGTMASG
jgi:hypothetical protein